MPGTDARPSKKAQRTRSKEHGEGAHSEPKGHKGPSTSRRGPTTKAHLYDLAKRFDVPGRSSMTKEELVDAVARAHQSRTRAASRYSAGF